MTVFGYLRSARSPDGGATIPQQRRHVRDLARRRGFGPIEVWHVDRNCSGGGSLEHRREGGKLVRALRRGDCVVISTLDRAFTDLANMKAILELMAERGAELHVPILIGDVVTDRGLRVLLDVLETFGAARAREDLASRDGRHRGGSVPIGHTLTEDGALELDPTEQEMIVESIALREAGLSYGRIGVKIGAEYRNGAPLHREQVRRLVERHRIELPEHVDRLAVLTAIERQVKSGLSWPEVAAAVSAAFGVTLDAGAVCRLNLADPVRRGGWTERVTA